MISKNIGLWIASIALAGSQFCSAQSTAFTSSKEFNKLYKMYEQQQQKLEQQSRLLKQQEQYLKSLEQRFNNLSQKLQQPQKNKPKASVTVQTSPKQTQSSPKQKASVARQSPAATNTAVKPVGEAHKQKSNKPSEQEIASISSISQDAQGILTPRGSLIVEPSFKYAHTSSNRVFLQGFGPLIIPSLFLGLIDIRETDRDIYTAALTARYGLTNRMQVEAKVPYLYREDSIRSRPLLINLFDDEVFTADGNGLGDMEIALDYQFNDGSNGWPFFTGSLRSSIPTGTDPFEVETVDIVVKDQEGDPVLDDDGNPIIQRFPKELATGTGFWGLQPSLTFIYPTDPAVFFGTVSYGWNFERDVGDDFGKIDPGDTFGLSGGMGFGINDRSSFSLGFSFKHVFETKQGGTKLNGTDADVARFLMGYAFRLNKNTNINVSIGIGATEDAPDFEMGIRLPITIGN